jgi:hypothetical protein
MAYDEEPASAAGGVQLSTIDATAANAANERMLP